METTLNVNESRMKEIAQSNITAHSLMLYFALRERHTESFNVRILKNELMRAGIPVNDKDLHGALEQLQKEKLGSIVYGKNGSDDHFKWGYNISQFNRAAFDNTVLDPILKLAPKERKTAFTEAVKEFAPVEAVKRGRGRPKGAKNKLQAKSVMKTEAKRSRGRPKGSKKTLMLKFNNGSFIKLVVSKGLNISEITG